MGTLERIRKTSPFIIGAVAVLLVLYFVVSDSNIARTLVGGNKDPKSIILGEINGLEVKYLEYEKKVEDESKDKGPDERMGIHYQVWKDYVEDYLLLSEAKNAGILISDKVVFDSLTNNPPREIAEPFYDSSRNFDKEQYQRFIENTQEYIEEQLARNPRFSEQEKIKIVEDYTKFMDNLKKEIRRHYISESVKTLVNTSGSFVSPLFLREQFIAQNSTADLSYIYIDANQIPDSLVTVTEDEIKEYYNKYKHLYIQKPQRKIKYTMDPIQPSHQDSLDVYRALDTLRIKLQNVTTPEEKYEVFQSLLKKYKGTKNNYTMHKDIDQSIVKFIDSLKDKEVGGPYDLYGTTYFISVDGRRNDSNQVVKASHILFRYEKSDPVAEDSARSEALKVLEKIKAGEDFGTLAATYSADPSAQQNQGDIGYFGKKDPIDSIFKEACFKAKQGEVVGPIKTQFGWHIIKVTEKQTLEVAYSEIKLKPEVSKATKSALRDSAYYFQKLASSGEIFDSLAKRFGKIPRESRFFGKNDPTIGSQYLTALIFDSKVGTVLEPFLINNNWIVIKVTEARESGLVSFEDMKDVIKRKLIIQKKLDALQTKASEIFDKAYNLNDLTKYSEIDPVYQVKSQTDFKINGPDYVFAQTVFQLPEKSLSGPVRGERAYYVVQINSKNIPDENTINSMLPNFLITFSQQAQSNAYWNWFNALKDNSDIEDYRFKYYRVVDNKPPF